VALCNERVPVNYSSGSRDVLEKGMKRRSHKGNAREKNGRRIGEEKKATCKVGIGYMPLHVFKGYNGRKLWSL